MKSDLLDRNTANEMVACLGAAAGEIEHSLELLEGKVSTDDFAAYKRMVGKIIVAIHSGLTDSILEAFPDLRASWYGNPPTSL